MKTSPTVKHICSLIVLSVMITLLSGCGQKEPVKRSWGKMKGLENIVGNMDPAQMGSLIGRLAGEQMGPELLSRIDESVGDGGGVADD